MSQIKITISKVGVKPPKPRRRTGGRPKGTGSIQKAITNDIIPLLERFPNPTEEGVVLYKQCRASWERQACKYPQLKFTYERCANECTKDAEWGYNDDGMFTILKPAVWAQRHNVYVTLRDEPEHKRVSLMTASDSIA